MLFRRIHLGRPSAQMRLPPSIAIGTLVAVVVVVIVAALWTSLVRTEPTHPAIAQCRAMSDPADRLSCYDRIEVPDSLWPAKGAIAPAPHRSN
jgi:hypothetical protein